VADLCREFGISRKTGYKIFDRYQECEVEGLVKDEPLVCLLDSSPVSAYNVA
jgi:hypothetical protein